MERFLAEELVRWGHFEVTVSPEKADAIMTETSAVKLADILKSDTRLYRTSEKSRGSMFLVNTASEKIIWGTTKKSSSSVPFSGSKSNQELAHEIIGQLRHDVNEIQKKAQKSGYN
jgi:hypothetical protein